MITSLAVPDFRNPQVFAVNLCAAVLLSVVKLKLPGLTSSVSLNTIPLLVAIAELSSTEAILIGFAGIFVQSFWHAKKRPSWLRLSFNLSVIMIAVNTSGEVFRAIRAWDAMGSLVAFGSLALVFFIMDTLPVCAAIALTERKRLVDIWRELYASSFHLFMIGAVVAGILSTSREPLWIVCATILPIFVLVYRAYWMFLKRLQEEKNLAAESASLNLRTIEALVAVIQAREGAHDGDDRLVQTYAVEIAKQLNLPEQDLKALAAAALLRDIGKVAIPDHLLSRPGQLTPDEMDRVKKHVTIGADILTRVNFPFPVVPIVRAHHEKWDGTGYPDGLKAGEIPLAARILAAVDSLIAMTSERPQRPAMPLEEAMAIIAAEANRSFDPNVVAALESRTDDLRSTLRLIKEREKRARPIQAVGPEDPEESCQGGFEGPLQSITLARREEQVFAGTDSFLNLKESLSVFAIRLKRVVNYDTIAVYSQVGDRLVPEFVSGDESKVFESTDIPVGKGVTGLVAEKGKAIIHRNNTADVALWHSAFKTKTRSAIAVPIESTIGRRGVLTLYSSKENAFTNEDLRVLLAVRLKILDWELHPLASSALLANVGAAIQEESAEMSFSSERT